MNVNPKLLRFVSTGIIDLTIVCPFIGIYVIN